MTNDRRKDEHVAGKDWPVPEREAEEDRGPMVRTVLSWGGCEVYAAGELRAVIDLLIRLEGAGT